MLPQVCETFLDRGRIRVRQPPERRPSMVFQATDGCHEHHHVRADAGLPAFDVQKLLRAEVRAESGFGNGVLGQTHRQLGRDHRIASVRDIGERTSVDDRGVVLERLDQIRF